MFKRRPPLYPLKFEPIYKQKVWGGRAMAKLGRALPGDDRTGIGESWELADLGETSASGGGGEAARSTITNGVLAGKALHEVMDEYGRDLMGDLPTTESGEFPLLLKFLDAHENLSVQVHPSADYAAAHDDAHLKSEAWYIVAAEPGAVIYKGMQPGTTAQQLRAALQVNTVEAVEPLMVKVPVKVGDCHYLPSGTCHALGRGVLVAEVQTPSDTTFRVFDWGRTGRQLHVDEALQCIHFGPAECAAFEKRTHQATAFTTVSRLVTCEFFRIEKVRMSEGYQQEIPYDQPAVWMVLEGKGTIQPGGKIKPVEFERGETLLIPPSMKDPCIELFEDTSWLEVTFPQARRMQIA